MKKRNGHLWKLFLCLLFLLLFCSACKQTEPPQNDTTGGNPSQTVEDLIPYYMDDGYFYLGEGILLSSRKRMMYSGWEKINFQYICRDLTCEHKNDECSAFLPHSEGDMNISFGVYYQDKLVIIHTYCIIENVDSVNSELDYITCYTHKTDVYEADKDGKNRKLVTSFDGGMYFNNGPKAALLVGDTLYFGGKKTETETCDFNETTGELEKKTFYLNDGFFALNLSDYSVECFAEEEQDSHGYLYNVYYKNQAVYGIKSSGMEEKAVVIRLSLEDGSCEKLLQFDRERPLFVGVVDNQLFYEKADAIMTFDMKEKKEKVFFEHEDLLSFVIGKEVFVRTGYSLEEGRDYVEFTSFDKNGKKLKEYRFDEYIAFMNVIGDKVTYVKCCTPQMEEWWCNVSDIADLLTRGEYIGPLLGNKNDTLD